MHRSLRPIGCSLLTGTVSLLNASHAFPWGSKGHEIIAVIAETQLTDTVRKRITLPPAAGLWVPVIMAKSFS